MGLCCGNVSSYKQDSVWSWFICFCTTTCMILTIGFAFALGVLFPVLMDSFEESRERTAWASSIIIGVMCFLGPVMGALLNRFGFRVTTILGCLSCSVGLALGSFAPNIIIFYIACSLPFAVGVSFIYVSSPIIVTHYFTKRRPFALGMVSAGQGLGTMILGPTLQALVDVFDWRNTFRVFAGILTVTSLTGCLLHQRTSSSDDQNRGPSIKLNISLLKNSTVVILVISAGLYTFSRMVPYVHLIKHCDDLAIPADKSSTLYLFIGIFASLGRLGAGFLCNMRCTNSLRLLQAAVFVMGASTMLLTLAKTYAALVVYAITFSIADGMMVATFTIKCMHLECVEESKRASAFGFTLMSSGILALSSPPLAGFMADSFGNYIAAFLMAGGVGVVGSIIPFTLSCFKRESEQNIDHNLTDLIDEKQSGEQ
ncbi:monocarboxylate transporter 10-like [Oculina patagonica]